MKFRRVVKDGYTTKSVTGPWTISSDTRGKNPASGKGIIGAMLKKPVTCGIEKRLDPGIATRDCIGTEKQHSTSPGGSNTRVRTKAVNAAGSVVIIPSAKNVRYFVVKPVAPPSHVVKFFYVIATKVLLQKYGNKDKEDAFFTSNDQLELLPAGLLSLEAVLIPSVTYQENKHLRRTQSRVQRDAPDETHITEAGRIAVVNCFHAAKQGSWKSRLKRRALEDQREQKLAEERQSLRGQNRKARVEFVQCRRAEEGKTLELQQTKQKRELKRTYYVNQDLWREVAFLMTGLSRLERETQLWGRVTAQVGSGKEDASAEVATRVADTEKAQTTGKKSRQQNKEVKSMSIDTIADSALGVVTSSNNIQATLKLVSKMILDSANLRKDLFCRYRQDHQFEGYHGVNDPKGLIQLLSQGKD